MTYKTFIGGDFVDAASGETMEVINPATGETIAEVPSCGAEDVDRAVEGAKKALPAWLDTTPKERSELLHKLADVLEENAEELAQLESRNVGNPLMMAVWKLGPALAAGNCQILKPSEQTPLSLLRFAQLAQDVLPTGVLSVV